MLFLHGKGRFVQIFHIEILQYVVFRYVAEQGDLVFNSFFQRKLRAADDDIRLDAHALQFLDRCLRGFGLHLSGSFQIRNQSYMDDDGVVMSHFVLKLTDGFQERLTLDIAHRTSGLNDGDMHVFRREIPIKPALDLVGNVRDDLYSTAAVIAPALLLQDGPVYLAGGNVGVLVQAFVDKTLIMSQIQICLSAVIRDEDFAVLHRIHGSRVDVDIRVEFLHGDFVAARF